MRRVIAARLAALRSPSVLLRVLADILVIDVTLVAVVAAEIVLVAAGSSLDVLVPGSANRGACRVAVAKCRLPRPPLPPRATTAC